MNEGRDVLAESGAIVHLPPAEDEALVVAG